MKDRSVVLVNSNEMKPPVAPLALDYIGDRLASAGIEIHPVDLSFADDPDKELVRTLGRADPIAVGISFRNTDDCFWPSCAWFVPRLYELIKLIQSATAAPIVLGGCGFGLFPRQILDYCGLGLGLVGDGEETLLQLVQHLEAGTDYCGLAGLAYRDDDGRVAWNPPRFSRQLTLPVGRRTIDNHRYLHEGGMSNIETKRGCPMRCIYCADPISKGVMVRCRDPRQVADEIESLIRQDVDVFHLCDCEFNIPPDHATTVCEEIIARDLGDRIRWYCYATASPFSYELALVMRQAGCVGINFGVDSGCDRMLAVLGRSYRRDTIRATVNACRRAGIIVMLDLLIGAPGEDEASVAETIDFIKAVDPDRAGAATGVRIYPGTKLSELVAREGFTNNPNLRGHVEQNEEFFRPVFYLDHRLGEDPAGLVADLIADDERFFPPPRVQDASNYNYNDNTVLEEAVAAGYRGAFWDILRQLANQRRS